MYGYPGQQGQRIRLADNPRTQTKAAIKRASKAARREATRLVGLDIKALHALYTSAAADLQATILAAADSDGNIKITAQRGLLNSINERLVTLSEARDAQLKTAMQANAATAIKPFTAAPEISTSLSKVAHDAVQFVQSFVAADGLHLSDRVWVIDNGAKEQISNAVQSAIIKGQSATSAAQDFINRGEGVPGEVVSKINSANAAKLQKIPGQVLMTGEGNAYAHAERVFRTEINRAHIETYRNSAFSHPDVIGTKFLLSPRHPHTDICDLHANANLYGLGPGVYPKGKSPLPAHPNTLSYEVVVFDDEVTEEDKKGKQKPTEFLKQQPQKYQQQVLGKNKAWALRKGYLKDNELTTPWRVIKPRLEKLGLRPA